MASRKKASRKASKKAPKRPPRKAAKAKKARKPAPPRTAKPAAPRRTRDGGPPGWPTLSPYLVVRNGQKSLEFYAAAFGFKSTGEVMRNDAGEITHAGMRLGDAAIMFGPEGISPDMKPPIDGGGADNLSLYVYVPNVDALAARAARAGAAVLQQPADQFWGDRTAVFKDGDGYHWTFATHIGGFNAEQSPQR